LPFPLASILRVWQATASDDYKSKYEHLLQFFEATAQFLSVIFLSGFTSQVAFFEPHREKLVESWKKQKVSLERPTFGTWRITIEYLAKQTRDLLSGDSDANALCKELFADPNLSLVKMLTQKDIAAVLATTNKMRNDWSGHGGVVARRTRGTAIRFLLRNFRNSAKQWPWKSLKLIRGLHCKPRGSTFENEVALLVGSNVEFLKEPRTMTMWLDVDRLYLLSEDANRALKLLPLMFIGASPPSAKNACYFFNRVEKDGLRFVSYHFADKAELIQQFIDASAAIQSLVQPGAAPP